MDRKISIIIPTFEEEANLKKLIPYLLKNGRDRIAEIIVSDSGSKDQSIEVAKEAGAKVWVASRKSRGVQMHEATAMATGDIYYFVHADSIPPESFVDDILKALGAGYESGCYRFRFDQNKGMLRVNSYCTRFNLLMCRGGDQTLFVTRSLYDQLKGFRTDYIIMEDYDFIKKARKKARFRILPGDVVVSARKYQENGYLQVNFANLVVFTMYRLGYPQMAMVNTYKKLIHHPKL